MFWPNPAACAQAIGGSDSASLTFEGMINSDLVRAQVREKLVQYNQLNPSSSKRVQRFTLLAEPASMGDGEITEKGYVNQGVVQARRADIVASLYAEPGPAVVLV